MFTQFRDRNDAGRRLAVQLGQYAGRQDVLVLALPRGGVPVGFEVAKALGCPMDLWIVRKLGVPGEPELAMGAIATGGTIVVNDRIVREMRIPAGAINTVIRRERAELQRRECAFRDHRPLPQIRGRIVILVDDGLATGATMSAAVLALREHKPQKVVVAVPVASVEARESIRQDADEVICVVKSDRLSSIGAWYQDFTQTSDREVQKLLNMASAHEQVGLQAGHTSGTEAVVKTDVPSSDWEKFFTSFADAHRGRFCSVEVWHPNGRGSESSEELPLLGLTVDVKGLSPAWIMVNFGAARDRALSHIIPMPVRVRLSQSGQGEDKELEIDSEDGTSTVLVLRPTASCELRDGIARAELVEG